MSQRAGDRISRGSKDAGPASSERRARAIITWRARSLGDVERREDDGSGGVDALRTLIPRLCIVGTFYRSDDDRLAFVERGLS